MIYEVTSTGSLRKFKFKCFLSYVKKYPRQEGIFLLLWLSHYPVRAKRN
jgi:hypothetical protein